MARRHEGRAKDWARCHWRGLATDGAAYLALSAALGAERLPDAALFRTRTGGEVVARFRELNSPERINRRHRTR